MKKIIWEAGFASPPPVLRYCKKCRRKMEYASSGQFRVNAQGKNLDIWLIYKCPACEATWNAAVYSRVSPKALDPELLERFYANDEDLARMYAMNIDFLRRNGGEVGMGEYEVRGEDLDFTEPVEVHIIFKEPVKVKTGTLLRRKLGVSRKRFEELVADGSVTCVEGEKMGKGKWNREIVVLIDLNISSHF